MQPIAAASIILTLDSIDAAAKTLKSNDTEMPAARLHHPFSLAASLADIAAPPNRSCYK